MASRGPFYKRIKEISVFTDIECQPVFVGNGDLLSFDTDHGILTIYKNGDALAVFNNNKWEYLEIEWEDM